MADLISMLAAAAGNAGGGEETDEYFQNTVLLLHGDGNQGATNFSNTGDPIYLAFKDNSSNNFPITVNGDAYGDNFGPYALEDGNWSTYFNAGTAYVDTTGGSAFNLTGDYTVECWAYPQSYPSVWRLWFLEGCAIDGSTDGVMMVTMPGATSVSTSTVLPLNQWSHVVVARSGSTAKVYLNGTQIYSVTNSASATNSFVRIGGFPGFSQAFPGYISNFRAVIGSAVYNISGSTISVPTTPLTAVTNTQLLTLQSNRFVDKSSSARTIGVGGSPLPAIAVFNPFGELPDGVNGSGFFDGTGDYATSPYNSEFDLSTGDFTVDGWFYANSSSGYRPIISLYGAGGTQWIISLDGSNYDVYVYPSGTTTAIYTSAAPVQNQWVYFALVRDGANFKFYSQGALLATVSSSTLRSVTEPLGIGTASGGTYLWNGYVSNLRILKGVAVDPSSTGVPTSPPTSDANTSLLTTQYAGTVRNVGFIDSGPYNFPITRVGNTTQGTFSPFSKPDGAFGNFFDGSGDYLSNTSTALITNAVTTFTVETWVYLTANPPADANGISAMCSLDGQPTGPTNYLSFGPMDNRVLKLFWFDGAVKNATGSTAIALNEWTHIACVVDSNSVQFYVNGVAESMSGTTTLTNRSGTQGNFSIGSSSSGVITGYLSNFRVTTTAVYTTGFTPSTSPLTNITNTKILTCQSNRFVDNSTNAYALTANGNVAVTPFSPFPLTTAYDPAVNGGAGYFDESGDYLQTPSFSVDFSVFCMEFWLNTTSTTSAQTFINRGGSNWGVTTVFNVYMSGTTDGYLTLLNGTGGVGFNTRSTTKINDGAWHHIVYTYDGTTYRVFQDGVLEGTQTTSSLGSDSQAMYFMHDPRTLRYGQGYLSDFRLVTGSGNIPAAYQTASTTLGTQIFTPPTAPLTAVSGTSLLLNFTNAGILDNTGFNALETVGNAQVDTSVVKYGTGSMKFDGTGDYLTGPNQPWVNFGTSDFTIECWVYFNSVGSTQMLVSSNYNASTGAGGWAFLYRQDNTTLKFTCNSNVSYEKTWSPSINTWYHVAVSRSGTDLRFFVDGTQLSTTSTSSDNISGATTLIVGSNLTTPFYLNGYIDDLRITAGVARYTTTFTPPTKAFPDIGS